MPNIPPQPKIDQITWFETHLPFWQADPGAFGLPQSRVAQLAQEVAAARAAYDAALFARVAAKNATMAQDTSVRSMLSSGREVVNIIKAHINDSGNQALWGASGIAPSSTSRTAPDPVPPHTLTTRLDTYGGVVLEWKTSQPVGVSNVTYTVHRAINGGPFALLDSVGAKMLIDETVPIGARSVAYIIKASRGGQSSDWSSAITMRFGRVGGNAQTSPMKIAA